MKVSLSPSTRSVPSGPGLATCCILSNYQANDYQDKKKWPENETGACKTKRSKRHKDNNEKRNGERLNQANTVLYLWILLCIIHYLPPQSVHRLVSLTLHWQLTIDIIRREDRLQIEPGPLTQSPLFKHILKATHSIININFNKHSRHQVHAHVHAFKRYSNLINLVHVIQKLTIFIIFHSYNLLNM